MSSSSKKRDEPGDSPTAKEAPSSALEKKFFDYAQALQEIHSKKKEVRELEEKVARWKRIWPILGQVEGVLGTAAKKHFSVTFGGRTEIVQAETMELALEKVQKAAAKPKEAASSSSSSAAKKEKPKRDTSQQPAKKQKSEEEKEKEMADWDNQVHLAPPGVNVAHHLP